MTQELTIGFLPLVDACLPILAKEQGFAEEEGLNLRFERDSSWASVLDRLLYGHSDVAHLLGPLAIATTLGLGRPAEPLAAPFVLGLNGSAITFRNDIAARICSPGQLGDPREVGLALKAYLPELAAKGRRLRLGVVHRYSSHNFKLRYWLAACGIHPDEDVEIVTVSPPFVADAMESGEIDGTCVGEPWNSVTVERGVGTIVLATAQIWRRGAEKVLATKETTLEAKREPIEALIRAMRKAAKHFIDPDYWEQNAEILARAEYLDGDKAHILRAISDRLVLKQGADMVHYPDFMFQYSEAANFPWVSQASWLYSQMVRWQQLAFDADDAAKAAGVFRPDVYRAALRNTGDDLPTANSKVEGSVTKPTQVGTHQGSITLSRNSFFDKKSFDPDHLQAYLGGQD